MGAADFCQFIKGDSLRNAFIEARDQARYEHGSGGYTGTLAEKHDYVLIAREPLHPAIAETLARRLLDEDDERIADKHGPAGVIPVAPADAFTTRTRTVTVKTEKAVGEISPIELAQAALPGEQVAAAQVLEEQRKCKVQVRRAPGRQRRVYEVVGDGRGPVGQPSTSLSAAIKRAQEIVQHEADRGALVTLNVRGTMVAQDGGPLVTVQGLQTSRRVKLEVTLVKPRRSTSNRPAAGWLVFGYASE